MADVQGSQACAAMARPALTRLRLLAAAIGLAGSPAAPAAEPCTPPIARVVSVQGQVLVERPGAASVAAALDTALCAGDTLRVQPRSRAAVQLANETTLRLDQGTVLTIAPPGSGRATLLQQLGGGLHVMTRTPRAFTIRTPFVNANIEGTEFGVRVDDDAATVAVYEGTLIAANDAGSVRLASGEQASAGRDAAAPRKSLAIRPDDAVAWTLYVPTVLDYRRAALGAAADAGRAASLALYRQGRVTEALAALDPPSPRPASADALNYRAALLMQVGRLDQAHDDLAEALRIDPRSSDAHALQSVAAVAGNDRERAMALALRAVELDADSPGALSALSYAQQSRFELAQALASVERALQRDPGSALAQSRRAELEMSLGRLDAALDAAQRAVQLDPGLGRTQTVLGFARLVRMDTPAAREAFRRAIALDQADPLPWLGLGLATIREGGLQAGRAEFEVAAILDPLDSTVRSYLAKAYLAEHRGPLAAEQLRMARLRDPLDPTPSLYDAIRLQAANRPVQALAELARSIELNDNRAVYRSRLLLDEDAAARSASQARIYADLGFDQLALNEAVKSLSRDPANASAHGFLADQYLTRPRHEMARDSELLQAQLLQPLNANPIQPRLASQGLGLFDHADFSRPGAGEYSELLTAQKWRFSVDAAGGSGGNQASTLIASGLTASTAFSVGHFTMGSQGFRANNDQQLSVSNAFVQHALSPLTHLQAELRRQSSSSGDTALSFFDEANHDPSMRERLVADSVRLGLRHDTAPGAVLLVSWIARRQTDDFDFPSFGLRGSVAERSQLLEWRHIRQAGGTATSFGMGYLGGRQTHTEALDPDPPEASASTIRHLNAYGYLTRAVTPTVDLTLGISADAYRDFRTDRRQLNPKLGLLWNPDPRTTLRLAAFRALKRRVVTGQTIEPTGLVGFNQFFSGINDINGTDTRLAGVGLTRRLTAALTLDAEWSRRLVGLTAAQIGAARDISFTETQLNAHAYWLPARSAAVSLGIEHERLAAPPDVQNPNLLARASTWVAPLQLRWFNDHGFVATLRATALRQRGEFFDATAGGYAPGRSQAVLLDFSIGRRLPDGRGLFTVELRNALDRRFSFQEINPQNTTLPRRRTALAKLSLNF